MALNRRAACSVKELETMSEPNPPSVPSRAWAASLKRFDKAWTNAEGVACAVILVLEIVALCIWIILKNMPTAYVPGAGGSKAGLVLRALLGGIFLAIVAHKVMNKVVKRPADAVSVGPLHGTVVSTALVIGLLLGRTWASFGAEYFTNIYSWLQASSSLVMVNGLRGFASRMTLLVALLGASIATAKAKHINVDFAMRALPSRFHLPAAVTGWVGAAAVCMAASFAFFDFIAIGNFQAPSKVECSDGTKGPSGNGQCDPAFSVKWSKVMSVTRRDLFVARRQVVLDAHTLGRVLHGDKFNEFPASEWNAWLDAADWSAYAEPDELATFHEAEGKPRDPRAPVPGGGDLKLLLVKEFNLFVFGIWFNLIAIRFLIRAILALAGEVSVDPDAAHASGDEGDHDRSEDALAADGGAA